MGQEFEPLLYLCVLNKTFNYYHVEYIFTAKKNNNKWDY